MYISRGTSERLKSLRPLRYGISSCQSFPDLRAEEYIAKLFGTSANMIQWREKDLDEGESRRLVRECVRQAKRFQKILMVNSSERIALEEGADGVHLTSNQDLRKVAAVAEGKEGFIIGKSVHSLERAVSADQDGADYILLAPVFQPLSKQDERPVLGLKQLARICSEVSCPVLALGGITSANVESVLAAGCWGYAGISWIATEIRSSRQGPGASSS